MNPAAPSPSADTFDAWWKSLPAIDSESPETLDDRTFAKLAWDAALLASAPAAAVGDRTPDGYAYRYLTGLDGSSVIRHSRGEEINGTRPYESIPYYYGSPPDTPAAPVGGFVVVPDWVAEILAPGNWRDVHPGRPCKKLSVTYAVEQYQKIVDALAASPAAQPSAKDGVRGETMCAYCGSLNGGHTLACQSIHIDTGRPAQVPVLVKESNSSAGGELKTMGMVRDHFNLPCATTAAGLVDGVAGSWFSTDDIDSAFRDAGISDEVRGNFHSELSSSYPRTFKAGDSVTWVSRTKVPHAGVVESVTPTTYTIRLSNGNAAENVSATDLEAAIGREVGK